jgi:hypothetical protein
MLSQLSKFALIFVVASAAGCVRLDDNRGGTNPFGDAGFRVLIVEENGQRAELPEEQRAVLTSRVWRDEVKQMGGEVRTTEPDVDPFTGRDAKTWNRPSTKPERLPWIYVGKGRRGVSQPFPRTAGELDLILKKVAQ